MDIPSYSSCNDPERMPMQVEGVVSIVEVVHDKVDRLDAWCHFDQLICVGVRRGQRRVKRRRRQGCLDMEERRGI
jgi:hypothetical protein